MNPVSSTNFVKNPSGFWSKRCAWSNSTASPPSTTSTRSLSMTVCKRCAIVSTVHSANFSRIVFWRNLSVVLSTFAVASSKINILFLRKMARAKQTRPRCPTLKFDALSCTLQSKPFGSALTAARKSTYFECEINCLNRTLTTWTNNVQFATDLIECTPQFIVAFFMEWIQIIAHRSRK